LRQALLRNAHDIIASIEVAAISNLNPIQMHNSNTETWETFFI
jgi:hypothetical protein